MITPDMLTSLFSGLSGLGKSVTSGNSTIDAATKGLVGLVGAVNPVAGAIASGAGAALSLVNSATEKKIAGTDTNLLNNISGYGAEQVEATQIGGVDNFLSNIFNRNKPSAIKKAENKLNNANYQNYLKSSISQKGAEQQALGQANFRDTLARNNQALEGNAHLQFIKSGGKLKEIKKIKKAVAFNLIPSGQLHSRKHNIEGIENITGKGIPVISMEEGGEISQQAEIEKNEVIIHKELTDTIEKLFEKYQKTESVKEKDEIAIKAGKILSTELIDNVVDNTGLMNTI